MNHEPLPADEWAMVEIFGHRRHVGRITEVERFGTKMLRIDEPTGSDGGFQSHFYGGGSIFSIRLMTESAARAWMARYRPATPVAAIENLGADLDPESPY